MDISDKYVDIIIYTTWLIFNCFIIRYQYSLNESKINIYTVSTIQEMVLILPTTMLACFNIQVIPIYYGSTFSFIRYDMLDYLFETMISISTWFNIKRAK